LVKIGIRINFAGVEIKFLAIFEKLKKSGNVIHESFTAGLTAKLPRLNITKYLILSFMNLSKEEKQPDKVEAKPGKYPER
jgi:hypothetical protein